MCKTNENPVVDLAINLSICYLWDFYIVYQTIKTIIEIEIACKCF